MKHGEPGVLTEVWALSTDLEEEPLLSLVFLCYAGWLEFLLFVVGLDQVVDDGTAFPQGDAGVGVMNGRDSVQIIIVSACTHGMVVELTVYYLPFGLI